MTDRLKQITKRILQLENNLNCEDDSWAAEVAAHNTRIEAWGEELDRLMEERENIESDVDDGGL